jgi:ribonuclease D
MTRSSRLNQLSSLPLPRMIDHLAGLKDLAKRLRSASRVAIDTESNSLFAYQERVCLIQLSTDEEDFLIDPLAFDKPADLNPLGELTAAPSIEKVFHAAEYDVMCLRRDFGFEFANLFDTMIAARVLGWEQIGLGHLLESYFGVKTSKRHQRANWGRRPLPKDMLRYAQMDTHYLLPIRDDIHDLLESGGHLEEARELFDEVCTARWNGQGFDPEGFWQINGTHELSPKQLAILQELYLFRDKQARRRNLPPFKVMGDKTLVSLAEAVPTSTSEMNYLPGMNERQVRRYGTGILKAVRRGLQAAPPKRSRQQKHHPSEVVKQRYEALHQWRKERAAQRGVPSDIIVSREALWEVAHVAPRNWEQFRKLRKLGPWRMKTYGDEILAVLSDQDG